MKRVAQANGRANLLKENPDAECRHDGTGRWALQALQGSDELRSHYGGTGVRASGTQGYRFRVRQGGRSSTQVSRESSKMPNEQTLLKHGKPTQYRRCDVCGHYAQKLSAKGWCSSCEADCVRVGAEARKHVPPILPPTLPADNMGPRFERSAPAESAVGEETVSLAVE